MGELLLELFSEEIPARMQARAAGDLERLVTAGLEEAGLAFTAARAFATPRRLALVVEGLPEASPPKREERRGPRVGAPKKALEGFMRAAGLARIEDAEIVSDPRKGDYYLAVTETPGRPTGEIVAEIVPDLVRRFPWPKAMRWGAGRLKWVRPLHSILCLFDGKPVAFEVDGIASGAEARGHRFMAPDPFAVSGFADYRKALKAHKVVLSGEERARMIARSAARIAEKEGLALVEDEALLAENAGLTEWPVVLAGRFDEAFLDVPAEVLTTAMKAHQKCFSLRDPKTGRLANRFLMVANLQAKDRGRAIAAGNERVIRARLSDAKFFWENDRRRPLDELVPKLDGIVFHEKLGTVGERVRRLEVLARALAPRVGADAEQAARAARLAKADLVSEMVYEFPELQGIMGRYYALEHGEPAAIADAIAEHYSPKGPGDTVPTAPVSMAVALADKLDQLVCFWAIGETPTGSKDPYALRRAALGVIRIILENGIRLRLFAFLARPFAEAVRAMERQEIIERILAAEQLAEHGFDADEIAEIERQAVEDVLRPEDAEGFTAIYRAKALDLLGFFADRLKVHLRDQGARHDLIGAVFALGGQDDLVAIVRRVEALGRFLATEDGANLLAGTKRAANILRIEEKRDKRPYGGPVDPALLAESQERALHKAISSVAKAVDKALAREDFEAAMAAMARLRKPVDAFFDHVTVNAEDAVLRENRLRLLAQIRDVTRKVADFSQIEG